MSSGNDSYELFWDDQSRLIDMVVTKQPIINTGIFTVRWHYHYLGTTLLAATREVEQGTYDTSGAYRAIYRNGWTVKRFWVIADERGLPHRMLDEQGAEYWRATWDAAGWRTISTQAADMQVWFGLPGQLLLPYTDAYTSGLVGGVTKTWYRAPIALNQWRAYDALTGMYLQPDDADRIGRTDPEGYAYARSSPTTATDRTGAEALSSNPFLNAADPYNLDFDGCDFSQRLQIVAAVDSAFMQITSCTKGACGPTFNPAIQSRWMYALLNGKKYSCKRGSFVWNGEQWSTREDGIFAGSKIAATDRESVGKRETILAPAAFFSSSCLANLVAHEAAHQVVGSMFWSEVAGPNRTTPQSPYIDPMVVPQTGNNLSIETAVDAGMHMGKGPPLKTRPNMGHNFVIPMTDECVSCQN